MKFISQNMCNKVHKTPCPAPGTYALILRLKRRRIIPIGRLGPIPFLPGWYTYAGSALGSGGVAARLRHHLRISEKPRWHLDYLRREAEPVEAWVLASDDRREHDWAGLLSKLDDSVRPVPGFGCSDCRCASHLFHFRKRPVFNRFRALQGRIFPDDPGLKRIPFSF